MRLGNVVLLLRLAAGRHAEEKRGGVAVEERVPDGGVSRGPHETSPARGFGFCFCVGNVRDERADEFHGDASVSRDEDAARGVQSCAEALYAVDVAHGDGDASRRGDVGVGGSPGHGSRLRARAHAQLVVRDGPTEVRGVGGGIVGVRVGVRVGDEEGLRDGVDAGRGGAHDGEVGVREGGGRALHDVENLEGARDALDVAHALDGVAEGDEGHGVVGAQAAELLHATRARDAGAHDHAARRASAARDVARGCASRRRREVADADEATEEVSLHRHGARAVLERAGDHREGRVPRDVGDTPRATRATHLRARRGVSARLGRRARVFTKTVLIVRVEHTPRRGRTSRVGRARWCRARARRERWCSLRSPRRGRSRA